MSDDFQEMSDIQQDISQREESVNEQSEESKNEIPPPKTEKDIIQEEFYDLTKRKRIILRPCLRNTQIVFTITKTKFPSFFSKYSHEFKCYLTFPPYVINTIEKDLVMVARKFKGLCSTKYSISIDQNFFEGNKKAYLGEVTSNFKRKEFSLHGIDFKNETEIQNQNLAHISYPNTENTNFINLETLVPEIDHDGERALFNRADLKEKWDNNQKGNIQYFCNKLFRQSVQTTLKEFNSRVRTVSRRNFKLISEEEDDENVYLQFGKFAKGVYTLEFQWPLSPLQAFGIGLSTFSQTGKLEMGCCCCWF